MAGTIHHIKENRLACAPLSIRYRLLSPQVESLYYIAWTRQQLLLAGSNREAFHSRKTSMCDGCRFLLRKAGRK
jgi:hypothetical protein